MAWSWRLDELLVDKVHTIGEPVLHVIDLALVRTAARLQSPFRVLARLSLAQFAGLTINQSVKVRQREMRRAQFLPAVNPLLPEIRIAEQPGPPFAAEEW